MNDGPAEREKETDGQVGDSGVPSPTAEFNNVSTAEQVAFHNDLVSPPLTDDERTVRPLTSESAHDLSNLTTPRARPLSIAESETGTHLPGAYQVEGVAKDLLDNSDNESVSSFASVFNFISSRFSTSAMSAAGATGSPSTIRNALDEDDIVLSPVSLRVEMTPVASTSAFDDDEPPSSISMSESGTSFRSSLLGPSTVLTEDTEPLPSACCDDCIGQAANFGGAEPDDPSDVSSVDQKHSTDGDALWRSDTRSVTNETSLAGLIADHRSSSSASASSGARSGDLDDPSDVSSVKQKHSTDGGAPLRSHTQPVTRKTSLAGLIDDRRSSGSASVSSGARRGEAPASERTSADDGGSLVHPRGTTKQFSAPPFLTLSFPVSASLTDELSSLSPLFSPLSHEQSSALLSPSDDMILSPRHSQIQHGNFDFPSISPQPGRTPGMRRRRPYKQSATQSDQEDMMTMRKPRGVNGEKQVTDAAIQTDEEDLRRRISDLEREISFLRATFTGQGRERKSFWNKMMSTDRLTEQSRRHVQSSDTSFLRS